MILNSVYIENFRIYRGPEKFDIASGNKKITVIQGNNDAGKTTLMNAISWCLYAVEKNTLSQKIYNSYSFHQTEVGEDLVVKVSLYMKDLRGNDVTVTRSYKYMKISEDACAKPEKTFEIIRNDGINDEFITFPESYINTHLPFSLKDYFLFDGEVLTQFFKKDNGNIKKDVFKLSQLDLIEKVKTHVDTRRKEFIKEKGKTQPKIAKLLEGINLCEENLEKYKIDLEREKKSIKINKANLEKIKKDLAPYGDDPMEIFEIKERLKKDHDDIKNKIISLNIGHKKMLFDNFSKIYGYPILKKVGEKGEQLKEDGFIPAEYRKSFLKFLLVQKKCICGRSLEENTPEYEEVKLLFENTDKITNISELINKFLGKIESIMDNYPVDFIDENERIDDELLDLETQKSSIEQEIHELNVKISKSKSPEDLKKAMNDHDYYQRMIDVSNRSIGRLETQIENESKRLMHLKKEYNNIRTTIAIVDSLDKKINFCTDIIDASKWLYGSLVQNIHDQLQELTTKEFNIYHWKNTYKSIEIDDDFNVEFVKTDGSKVIATDPSVGTRLTLALSFITSLNNLAGFELPIFIDTPLGPLDNDIRYNLGKFLPEFTKDKQIILLMKENEFSGDFKKNISKYIGEQYTLDVSTKDDREITRVV